MAVTELSTEQKVQEVEAVFTAGRPYEALTRLGQLMLGGADDAMLVDAIVILHRTHGIGAATGALALDAHGKSNAECGSGPVLQCTPAGVAFEDQAKTYAWFADFGVGLGAAAIITGVVLVLAAPRSAVRVAPVVTAHGAGAGVFVPF